MRFNALGSCDWFKDWLRVIRILRELCSELMSAFFANSIL
jgi:hypothetical protein